MAYLSDARGRRIDYARISVTDRCNYRCVYCMPEGGVSLLGHAEVMRYEEILFLCAALEELGVRKIRFTGGEPLVRRDMISFLLEFRKRFPDMAVALTTNAALLSRYAGELAALRLSGLNISLDTVDRRKFREITRTGEIEDVFEGIGAAIRAGIANIKTNTVLIRGFNDDELLNIMQYAWSNDIVPRLIEFMPLGDDVWNREKFIGATEILAIMSRHGEWLREEGGDESEEDPPRGPAKHYRDRETGRMFGIIEAVSNHFCATCNRLRVTAEGKMKACLFGHAGTDLLPLLRLRDMPALKTAIAEGVSLKPGDWEDVRDGKLSMSVIGG